MHRKRFLALAFVASFVTACGGGGGGATQAPATGGATAAPGDTGSPATQAPLPTAGSVPTSNGGGTAATACELLTPADAATALGTGELAQTGGELAGQTFCDYRDGTGASVLTTYMQATGATQLWPIYEGSLVTDPVSGLGDKAMFEPSTKLLLVLKGDAFFNVFVADVSLSPEQALEQATRLAQLMVGRL